MTSRVKRFATAVGSALVAVSGLVAVAPTASAAGLAEFHQQDVN